MAKYPIIIRDMDELDDKTGFRMYKENILYPQAYSVSKSVVREWILSLGGGSYTASNGITLATGDFKLGGTLSESTTIIGDNSLGVQVGSFTVSDFAQLHTLRVINDRIDATSELIQIKTRTGGSNGIVLTGPEVSGIEILDLSIGSSLVRISNSGINITTSTTRALTLPTGGTVPASVVSPANGMIKYDTTLNKLVAYVEGAWHTIDTTII